LDIIWNLGIGIWDFSTVSGQENRSFRNQLELAHKAPEVETLRKYQYDGTVEVWSQMSLSGGFAQLILPPEIRQIESIKQVLKPNSPSRL
jgi:hypothetical protein